MRTFRRKFITVLSIVVVLLGIVVPVRVNASGALQCMDIIFPSPIEVSYDDDGNLQAESMTVTIHAFGNSTFGDSDGDGTFESGYRFAYQESGDLDGWHFLPLSFAPDSSSGTGYYTASVQVRIPHIEDGTDPSPDRFDGYSFSVETESGVHLTYAASAPSRPTHSQVQYASDCGGTFSVNVATNPNAILAGSCGSFGYPDNFMTCAWNGSSWAYEGDGNCTSASASPVERCTNGGSRDSNGNYAQGTLPDPSTFGTYACISCDASTTEPDPQFTQQHIEPCNNEDLRCDLTPQLHSSIAGNVSLVLGCRASPDPSDSFDFRCQWSPNTAPQGAECIVGGNECADREVAGGYPLYCRPSAISQIGSCETTAEFTCFNEGEDAACTDALGEGAECVNVGGDLVCAPGEFVESEEPPVVAPPSDPQFGVQNCPEGEENAACVACVRQNGTWSALGCIVTTPEGIFTALIRVGLGIMGGVALIRLIYLGYLYQTGDQGKIKEARQGVISTLGAIVIVLFSIVIIRVIAVNILDVVPAGFFG